MTIGLQRVTDKPSIRVSKAVMSVQGLLIFGVRGSVGGFIPQTP